MLDDPIVAEVRAIRERLAAKFNYDLEAIYRDIKEQERASGREYVRYPPRPPQHRAGARSAEDAGPPAGATPAVVSPRARRE